MTTWARNIGNTAVDVTTADPNTLFHADVAAQFVEVPDGTATGATYADGHWTTPETITPPAPAVKYPVLTAVQFNLTFTAREELLIEALATTGLPSGSSLVSPAPTTAIPPDPLITVFWARFQRVLQTGSAIDMNLKSVGDALDYMTAPTAPTPVVLADGRATQIRAGVPQ